MAIYHLTCPRCGNEFDFDYNQFSSLTKFGLVIRYGAHSFSVKCPSCRKRARYHVTDNDRVE
ncbi:MAG: hypothetical protein P8Y70_20750 [Candidatus Lokiarchaeota archaeon]